MLWWQFWDAIENLEDEHSLRPQDGAVVMAKDSVNGTLRSVKSITLETNEEGFQTVWIETAEY